MINIYNFMALIVVFVLILLLVVSIYKEILRSRERTHALEIIAERQKVRSEETAKRIELIERMSK